MCIKPARQSDTGTTRSESCNPSIVSDPAGGGINLSLVVVKPIAKLTNRPANGPSQKAFDDPRQQFGSRRSAAMLYFDAAFNAHLGLNQAQAVALAKGPVLPKWCTG